MKYDEQLFNLSEIAHATSKPTGEVSKEIRQKQSIALRKLLEKFQCQLLERKSDDRFLRFVFRKIFWNDFDDGYDIIDELVRSGNFDSFASEYCMYISNVERRCDENNDAYYEVIWYYRTYFENLKDKASELASEETPADKPISSKECVKTGGHDYKWVEETNTEFHWSNGGGGNGVEGVVHPGRTGMTATNETIYVGVCARCGKKVTRKSKPAELILTEALAEARGVSRRRLVRNNEGKK